MTLTLASPEDIQALRARIGFFWMTPIRTVVLQLPGLSVDEARRRAFQAENSRLTVNKNNAFASVAMTAAYSEGGPWLEAAIDYIAGNLDLVRARLAGLPGVRLIEPEGTFLLWLDFRDLGLTPDDLTSFLRQKAKWAVTRGIAFGPEGAGFARINIACTRARLTAALDRLE